MYLILDIRKVRKCIAFDVSLRVLVAMLDEVEGRGQPGRFFWCTVLLTWPVLFPASSALSFEYIVLLSLSRKLGCH